VIISLFSPRTRSLLVIFFVLICGCGCLKGPDSKEELKKDALLYEACAKSLGDIEGVVIITDPSSGRIRAIIGEDMATRRAFPPGSLIKLVTVWAGLEDGVIDPNMVFDCNGSVVFSGRHFSCWDARGHGTLDLTGAISHSCNVYFYNLSHITGAERTYSALRDLGFGKKTGVNLAMEEAGRILPPGLDDIEDYAIGDTDKITATPLQVIVYLSALINGGKIFSPKVTPDERDIASFIPEIKGVIEVSRSETVIKRGMFEAVKYGTASRAGIEGFEIIGKTGTGGFLGSSDWTHGWFLGFYPQKNPKIGILVFIYRGTGGEDAAPVASEIFEEYFKIENGNNGD
jgi:penicillin-binding protein 2